MLLYLRYMYVVIGMAEKHMPYGKSVGTTDYTIIYKVPH
jgi:hypothetical protein